MRPSPGPRLQQRFGHADVQIPLFGGRRPVDQPLSSLLSDRRDHYQSCRATPKPSRRPCRCGAAVPRASSHKSRQGALHRSVMMRAVADDVRAPPGWTSGAFAIAGRSPSGGCPVCRRVAWVCGLQCRLLGTGNSLPDAARGRTDRLAAGPYCAHGPVGIPRLSVV